MSNVVQGTGKIWCRLFDHKAFIGGEITFTLQEFEEKRGETEVDSLFNIIEHIADIKDSQIDRVKEAINDTLPLSLKDLDEALNYCSKFSELEEYYKEVSFL
ncbi:unnamed protein product [Brassicogethes aeneus]|uniref:Biogenesis of lysosome-related organelles complex 1 subunit 5 n=1 Tax=Brassicogethes aeneus TaxID=1431903 RepID=A0A9P0BGC4_BRAAE|nr:unnamed protein product [Brassicogethes aeneus]